MLIKFFQYKWFLLITLELQALLRREIEILNHLNQLVWINLSKFSSMIKLISLGLGKKEKRQFDFIYLGSTLVSGQNWVRMDLGRLLLKFKKKKKKKDTELRTAETLRARHDKFSHNEENMDTIVFFPFPLIMIINIKLNNMRLYSNWQKREAAWDCSSTPLFVIPLQLSRSDSWYDARQTKILPTYLTTGQEKSMAVNNVVAAWNGHRHCSNGTAISPPSFQQVSPIHPNPNLYHVLYFLYVLPHGFSF